MIITKTTRNTYEVKFYPDALQGINKWGDFRQAREKRGISNKKFEKCFCCGHAFTDDETIVMVTVSGKGNRLACTLCLDQQRRIGT